MKSMLLFVIGLAFGTGLGFILGTPAAQHDHIGHDDPDHAHSALTQWDGDAPTLSLTINYDTGDGKNLYIDVQGFVFTPETVNGAPRVGTGHAHIYVDGVKVARAYSPWMHLLDAPAGAIVRVTLNANDHTSWSVDGQPIAAEITVP